MPTHRAAYLLLVGELPEGCHLHHICENRLCCNPEHLQPVTPSEHVLLGDAPAARHKRQTHCKHGHEFNAENTRTTKEGYRICKTCARSRQPAIAKRYRARHLDRLRVTELRKYHERKNKEQRSD